MATQTATKDIQKPISELTDEYSSLFEEQMSAFESDKLKMKKTFEDKIKGLNEEIKNLKNSNSIATAELDSFKKVAADFELKVTEVKAEADTAETQLRVELEKTKTEKSELEQEVEELKVIVQGTGGYQSIFKEKVELFETRERNMDEAAIKTELNTFESLLECEGTVILQHLLLP